jgi:hypothetical protein
MTRLKSPQSRRSLMIYLCLTWVASLSCAPTVAAHGERVSNTSAEFALARDSSFDSSDLDGPTRADIRQVSRLMQIDSQWLAQASPPASGTQCLATPACKRDPNSRECSSCLHGTEQAKSCKCPARDGSCPVICPHETTSVPTPKLE